MSDHRQRPPMAIRPVASRRLLGYVLLVHGSALAVVAVLPAHWAPRLALGLLVMASLVYGVWAQVLRRAPWSVVEAVWNDSGWTLSTRAGRSEQARLLPSSYVGVGLVILNLRCGRFRRRSLVLASDSVDADQLRRLRARLRIAGVRPANGMPGRADAAI
jgi:toxin CptA